MPHLGEIEQIDLPPTTTSPPIANAIPSTTKSRSKKSRKEREKHDTPRGFTRLFQPYRPPRAGEDDGTRQPKRRKVAAHVGGANTASSGNQASGEHEAPATTGPHRSDSVAVDKRKATHRNEKHIPKKLELSLKDISKASRTRTEKKMQKMQHEWRLEDERLKAKQQRMGEDQEGLVDEENVDEMGVDTHTRTDRKSKKRKKEHEADIWAAVGTKRAEGRPPERKGLTGLHDVVQAPPRLGKPASMQMMGGLKRQSELSEGRRQVIEGYRALMKQKRGAAREG